ncbi:MAG: 2-C-methyl-D-erythritol 4-phosphate cytidylyltransferase, partial [Muribaculaceae bacterium]|nr:2-C-methyl-D-erythritol 4-phosphate cytidylyltransferase [Muribaculaceae bacterium]
LAREAIRTKSRVKAIEALTLHPLVASYSLACGLVDEYIEHNKDYTDDCQLIESMGGRVHITLGSYTNIKITTPEDIYIAEALINNRKELASHSMKPTL